MGYIAHDVVIATTQDYREGGSPDIDAFRLSMPEEFRHLVIGPIETAVNGTKCYVFLPDGSKEGWDMSDEGDVWRERFKALFRFAYDDDSSPDDVISVRFGGDCKYDGGAVLTVDWPKDTL